MSALAAESGEEPNSTAEFPLLTELNVQVGCRVRKNHESWNCEQWGALPNHPPDTDSGTVLGWTDSDSQVFGDPAVGGFPEIVRVKFDQSGSARNYRMGFADEYWLRLLSGGVQRKKKRFCDDLRKLGQTGCFRRTWETEDMQGQVTKFIPQPASTKEHSFKPSLRVFWRLHAGDVRGVRELLKTGTVDIDEGIQPCEFPPDETMLPWPYSVFDGAYGDTLLSLATRYCHFEMISMLLENGANGNAQNEDGESAVDIAKNIIADASCIRVRPFSSDDISQLPRFFHINTTVLPNAEDTNRQLLCCPQFDVSTCNLDKCGSTAINWILINGHSDQDQMTYCTSMINEWKSVLTKRGDTLDKIITCPTKAELNVALQLHFTKFANLPTGIFVIAHGGDKEGEWVSFNPADENETFAWKDIVSTGALHHPSQLIIVADTCYSARLGKVAFQDLRRRQADDKAIKLPSFCMLSASDLPEKNFSVSFALKQFERHRMLSKQTCDLFVRNESSIEIVENIPFPETDDFNPYLFLFVPYTAILKAFSLKQPIFAL